MYECKMCNYSTNRNSQYDRHLYTLKHNEKMKQKTDTLVCCCGKKYQYKSGLCRHKKTCNYVVELEQDSSCKNNIILEESANTNTVVQTQSAEPTFTNEMIYEILKELSNANRQNAEFQAKLVEFMKDRPVTNITNITNHNGNTNNVQINIDTFLNQYCKDAIPMNEFIKNIQVSNEDVFYMAKMGNKNGVMAIVNRVLNEIKLIERSFHCTDAKRHTTYIKEEAGWTKTQDQKQLKRLCFYIGDKCLSKSIDICKSNPRYMQGGTEETKLMENIFIETSGGKLGFEHNNTLAANLIESKYHIDKKEMLEAITE